MKPEKKNHIMKSTRDPSNQDKSKIDKIEGHSYHKAYSITSNTIIKRGKGDPYKIMGPKGHINAASTLVGMILFSRSK